MVKLLGSISGSVLIHCGNGDDDELRFARARMRVFTRSGTRWTRLCAHIHQVGKAKEQQK